MNEEENLMDFDLDDLDVEELERRLEFAPWDPPPPDPNPPNPEPYCEPAPSGIGVVCGATWRW